MDKITKNSTEILREIKKVGFINSTLYKISQKYDKKLTLLIQNCFF